MKWNFLIGCFNVRVIFFIFLILLSSCSTISQMNDVSVEDKDAKNTRIILMERLDDVSLDLDKLSLKYEAFEKTEDIRYVDIKGKYHTCQALYYRLKKGDDMIAQAYFFLRSYGDWRELNYRNYNLYSIND